MSLYENTMAMLRARPRHATLPQVAQAAGVTPDWLAKLSQGKMQDPSVHKVQKLHDYLASRPW